jgi:hypothetical protein
MMGPIINNTGQTNNKLPHLENSDVKSSGKQNEPHQATITKPAEFATASVACYTHHVEE